MVTFVVVKINFRGGLRVLCSFFSVAVLWLWWLSLESPALGWKCEEMNRQPLILMPIVSVG